jgi:hypothetical protein
MIKNIFFIYYFLENKYTKNAMNFPKIERTFFPEEATFGETFEVIFAVTSFHFFV